MKEYGLENMVIIPIYSAVYMYQLKINGLLPLFNLKFTYIQITPVTFVHLKTIYFTFTRLSMSLYTVHTLSKIFSNENASLIDDVGLRRRLVTFPLGL